MDKLKLCCCFCGKEIQKFPNYVLSIQKYRNEEEEVPTQDLFCHEECLEKNLYDEDTQECVNDTYLSVWNLIPPTWPEVFPAFLGKITRNLALKRYEYNSTQKRNPDLLISFSELEDCIIGKNNIEQEYNAKVSLFRTRKKLKKYLCEKEFLI